MTLSRLSKQAAKLSKGIAPGLPVKKTTPLPRVTKPAVWEFSAHPHHAKRSGSHIDIRLGNPSSGVAHSLVLPKKTKLPSPGESALVIPTYDHTIPYMDYFGPISTKYGLGTVEKGRRTQTEVYHADPSDEPGTKLRFNLYEGDFPEEFAVRKDQKGRWFIHNKTQTREKRPDIPAEKPKYKEVDPDKIDVTNDAQLIMPKLDGAHAIIDLKAGRAPRAFSYRKAKRAGTGLIEHTHKMPGMLTKKVPKALDGTVLRAEIMGVKNDKAIPAEQIGGLLNSKVWASRRAQAEMGAVLKAFPFNVIAHKGKSMVDAPFSEKLKVLKEVERSLADLDLPEMATSTEEKINLLNRVKTKQHPLTEEGFVLVEKDSAASPIKAKFAPDFDVFVRGVHPAISAAGEAHDRAGSISYSWTSDGPVAGNLGGFKHREARDMLTNPDKYVGRVAKVKAMKVFTDKEGNPKALFQPRFKEWHLDKGDIEKSAELYHGSPKKLKVLKPKNLHGDPDLGSNVFASYAKEFALPYAGRKWGDRDIEQMAWRSKKHGERVTLREARPRALEEVFGGKKGYLYTVPEDTFGSPGRRRTRFEVVSKDPVLPSGLEVIPDVLEALENDPNVTLVRYDKDDPITRAGVRRNVKRMMEMTPEKRKGYLKWRLEKAPREVKKMFREEMKKKAEVEPIHVRPGTPVTSSLSELRKKMKPGDVMLSKSTTKPDFFSRATHFRQRLSHGEGPDKWTHVAVVSDKDSLIHAYDKIESGKLNAREAQVFEHSLDEFDDIGRDIYILRPSVAKKVRDKAVERAKNLVGHDYNRVDLLRTIFAPGKREEVVPDTVPEGIICTAVPAIAYPTVKISPDKSVKHMMPSDFAVSKELHPVIAYSGKKKAASVANDAFLDELEKIASSRSNIEHLLVSALHATPVLWESVKTSKGLKKLEEGRSLTASETREVNRLTRQVMRQVPNDAFLSELEKISSR